MGLCLRTCTIRRAISPSTHRNLQNYIVLDTLSLEEKAIRWFNKLLLHWDMVDDITEFDNGIMMAYGMCPPCTAMEYCQMEPERMPTHFTRRMAKEVWGDDIFEVMRKTAED
jgi:hypothetical protein